MRLEKRINGQTRIDGPAERIDRNVQRAIGRDFSEVREEFRLVEALPPWIVLRSADIAEEIELRPFPLGLYVPKLIHPFPPSPVPSLVEPELWHSDRLPYALPPRAFAQREPGRTSCQ